MLNMATIRRRRLMSSGISLSAYAVDGNEPDVVADFASATEYFRVGGSDTTFASMFNLGTTTPYRTSPATMNDSDGLLKWGPHNVLLQSADISNASWTKSGCSVVGTELTSAATNARVYQNITVVSGASYVVNIKVRKVSGSNNLLAIRAVAFDAQPGVWFDIDSGTVGTVESGWSNATITAIGSHYICSAKWAGSVTDVIGNFSFYQSSSNGSYANTVGGVFDIPNIWAYRADLGGMVDVPTDQQTSGTNATYVPTTTAARYLHRRGNHVYNGSSWVKKGIQIETSAATNLCTASNDFAGGWTSSNVTETAAQATSVDGNTNASSLTPNDTSSAEHATSFDFTITSGTTYCASVYAEAKASGRYIGIRFYFDAGKWTHIVYDLVSGVVTQQSKSSSGSNIVLADIEDCGGGIYRIIHAGNGTHTACKFSIYMHTSGTPTIGGTFGDVSTSFASTLDGFFIYGAQFELGSTPSSYIPTSGATVTRTADALTIPAANMSYSATAMSFQMDGTLSYSDQGIEAQETLFRWHADANNYISIDIDTDSTDTGQVNANQAASATVDTVVASAQYSPGVNVAFNVASRNTSSSINVAKDGTAATEDATPTALANLAATNFSLGYDFMGNVGQFRQFDAGLTDGNLETGTS